MSPTLPSQPPTHTHPSVTPTPYPPQPPNHTHPSVTPTPYPPQPPTHTHSSVTPTPYPPQPPTHTHLSVTPTPYPPQPPTHTHLPVTPTHYLPQPPLTLNHYLGPHTLYPSHSHPTMHNLYALQTPIHYSTHPVSHIPFLYGPQLTTPTYIPYPPQPLTHTHLSLTPTPNPPQPPTHTQLSVTHDSFEYDKVFIDYNSTSSSVVIKSEIINECYKVANSQATFAAQLVSRC